PATRGADGAGAGVLDGLFGRLTRLPPRTRCTRSPGLAMETGDELGMLLDRGRRSAEIFRHDRPWSPAGVPQATGARWCDPAIDRQMAQRGVLEDGVLTTPEHGTPQGGVISPLLANIVLHYVLDEWFAKEVRPRLKGEAFLIRYADDFVIGVAREDDARRIMEVLPKRMSKYGLTVHPEKTRVVRFHPADVADSEPADQNSTGPRTFDFLGFTHYWGRSLKGGWVVKRKTAKSRLKRAIHSLSDWCRQHLHQPIAVQHQTLKQKLQGHYAYYGITGNFPSLQEFLEEARKIWRHWLSRRRRDGEIPWSDFLRLEQRYGLPRPRVVHSLLRSAAKS